MLPLAVGCPAGRSAWPVDPAGTTLNAVAAPVVTLYFSRSGQLNFNVYPCG